VGATIIRTQECLKRDPPSLELMNTWRRTHHHQSLGALEAKPRTNRPEQELESKLPPFSFWFCYSHCLLHFFCYNEESDGNYYHHLLFFGFVATKKAMTISCRCFLFWHFAMKKATTAIIVAFFFGFVTTKKTIVASSYHRLLLWFYYSEKGGGNKLPLPSSFFSITTNKTIVVIFFFLVLL